MEDSRNCAAGLGKAVMQGGRNNFLFKVMAWNLENCLLAQSLLLAGFDLAI